MAVALTKSIGVMSSKPMKAKILFLVVAMALACGQNAYSQSKLVGAGVHAAVGAKKQQQQVSHAVKSKLPRVQTPKVSTGVKGSAKLVTKSPRVHTNTGHISKITKESLSIQQKPLPSPPLKPQNAAADSICRDTTLISPCDTTGVKP